MTEKYVIAIFDWDDVQIEQAIGPFESLLGALDAMALVKPKVDEKYENADAPPDQQVTCEVITIESLADYLSQ